MTLLNTVSSETLHHFDEMLRVSEDLSTNFFTVSPIIMATSRETVYRTGPLDSLKSFLIGCAESQTFQRSSKVKLDIGILTCRDSGEDRYLLFRN